MKILFVDGIYPEFQKELYTARPGLAQQPYVEQLAALLDSGFGHGDAYSHGFRQLGWEAADIIGDADTAQRQWATEHNLSPPENTHDMRRAVVAAQVEEFKPDVLYVFEWSPLGDAFLAEMKSRVRLLVGQVASPLPEGRTYAAYDVMLSSLPPLVDYLRRIGKRAEGARLGFDPRVLERVHISTAPRYDVTFVGGFAPSHTDRIAWLEKILRDVQVDVFGYGAESLPKGSSIRAAHRGSAWGWSMYEILAASRVTLNLHATITAGAKVLDSANNMRLFEATGMGTCLLTDNKPNLKKLFDPGREVKTFEDADDCVTRINEILANEPRCKEVAAAGQARTLRDHTYPGRMQRLAEILGRYL